MGLLEESEASGRQGFEIPYKPAPWGTHCPLSSLPLVIETGAERPFPLTRMDFFFLGEKSGFLDGPAGKQLKFPVLLEDGLLRSPV